MQNIENDKDKYIKYLEDLNVKHVEANNKNNIEYQRTFRWVITGTLIAIVVLYLGTLWMIRK